MHIQANLHLIAFIMYSFLMCDEDYCDKPVGANTTGVIKIYTIMDLGVLIFTCVQRPHCDHRNPFSMHMADDTADDAYDTGG